MNSVAVPVPRVGKHWAAKKVGHFADDAAFDRFLRAYLRGMDDLPAVISSVDIGTRLGTVRAYRFGSAPGIPLVLLPGRNASTPVWRANLASLITRRTVYTLDLLGEAGMSVQHKAIAGAEDQAAWLEDALAGLELDRVHMLGLSIGGWNAVNHAVRYPKRLASLTLLDPAMTFAPVTWKMLVVSLGAVIPGMPQWLRNRLLSWISGGVPVDESVPEAALISSGMRDFAMYLPTPRPFTDEQLRGLRLPVLAVIAGRSIVHRPQRAADRAQLLLPHARVQRWSDASHALNGEFPDRISDATHQFLDDVDGGARRAHSS
ncbi:alpha/beta fold hydrolase [Mycobacteroides salmoniphilum]|uniref:alpha/beta fold hydrolase n=1 Tax=Mycobacteroides salmoniphilum TaxID=404941 RepID=UPI0010651DF4|nr:alpha/beta hydrolase [Mycobacteroides salmoniphilum]TDZ75648.1 putative carboxylesterase nap [Mycobacteroides salmoniphilum]TDZ84167.1 putative carboxylesterase nap [Mycobacteroides salmoniphilum]